jgi:hypothetical protein
MNQEFFPVDIITPWYSMLIYHLRHVHSRPIGGCSSEI